MLELLVDPFSTLQICCYKHIGDVHDEAQCKKKKKKKKKIVLTNIQGFVSAIF